MGDAKSGSITTPKNLEKTELVNRNDTRPVATSPSHGWYHICSVECEVAACPSPFCIRRHLERDPAASRASVGVIDRIKIPRPSLRACLGRAALEIDGIATFDLVCC